MKKIMLPRRSWWDEEDNPPTEQRTVAVLEGDAPAPLLVDHLGRPLVHPKQRIGF